MRGLVAVAGRRPHTLSPTVCAGGADSTESMSHGIRSHSCNNVPSNNVVMNTIAVNTVAIHVVIVVVVVVCIGVNEQHHGVCDPHSNSMVLVGGGGTGLLIPGLLLGLAWLDNGLVGVVL